MSRTLSCRDLTICYHERPAVHHVSFDLPCGAFAAIVGPNGAGKSTLLHGILGWLPWTSGEVTFAGEPVKRCQRKLTYLPQRKTLDLDFPVDVESVVAMGRFQHRGLLGAFTAADRAAIDGAIAQMGLEKLRTRPLAELSGGQQQRAFLARALATGADVLLLDEPLTGLDEPSSHDLLARLRAWAAQDRLVIAVIHDLAAVSSWCTHGVLINRELVACGELPAVMAGDLLTRCYGRPAGGSQVASASASARLRATMAKAVAVEAGHIHGDDCDHDHDGQEGGHGHGLLLGNALRGKGGGGHSHRIDLRPPGSGGGKT